MPAIDAIVWSDCTGLLTINGVALNTYAWNVLDPTPLWMPPTRRGQDVVEPGQDGVRSYVRRPTSTIVSLPMTIVGTCDVDGVAYSDPWEGLLLNLYTLRSLVLDLMSVRPLVLTMPSGTTITGDVQVEDFTPGDKSAKGQMEAVLGVSLPQPLVITPATVS